MYRKKIRESFIAAGLDFFFGNSTLEGKKRRLPEYRKFIEQYRTSSIKTEEQRVEITSIFEQIKQ